MQVEFFDPAKASKSAGASVGLAALFGPAEAVAAAAAADAMHELRQGAARELPARLQEGQNTVKQVQADR